MAEGFANGLVAGALDERGYDNGWGEAARVLGQVVSGLLIYGDVRDGAVHLARRQWGEAALDALGVVPVAGDGIKIVRGGARGLDSGRPLTRMDEAIQDLEHLRRVYAPRRSRQELVRAAEDAVRLGNEGERLEGRVALMVRDDLVAFRHTVRSEGRIVGEVDVVTTKALIEVTGTSSSKAKQVRKLLIQMDLNPHTKPVVLFAPKYTPGAERAIVAMGAHVVRTEQELTALLRTLSGPAG